MMDDYYEDHSDSKMENVILSDNILPKSSPLTIFITNYNLRYLFISNNNITTLPNMSIMTHLEKFECNNNNLHTLPVLPLSLTDLQCQNNLLKDISNLPIQITILNISNNNVTSLPNKLTSLIMLRCSDNQIKAIPNYPKLSELHCSNNPLQTVNKCQDITLLECANNNIIPLFKSNFHSTNNIRYLFISDSKLTDMPDLTHFHNLEVLDVCNNDISHLHNMPSTLIELSCRHNNLQNITGIPKNIQRLDVCFNKITTIHPATKLKLLRCSHNLLQSVVGFPELTELSCNDNHIKVISDCPKLRTINCSNNKIERMTHFTVLENLYCENNDMNDLGYLPSLRSLHIYDNKNFNYLTYFDNLTELLCDDTLSISKKYRILNMQNMKAYVLFELE